MLDIHMKLDPETDLRDEVTFNEYRKQLREKLLAEALIDPESPGIIISATFSGSGDSGDWDERDPRCENDHLGKFFDFLLNEKVTWDWYNNDGGGGDIEWNLETDVIEITGYWNEMTSVDADGATL